MTDGEYKTGQPAYVLPGAYSHVEQIGDHVRIVTFQTKDELQEYLDELLRDEEDDEDKEDWNAPE